MLGDQRGGAEFAIPQLGVLMDIAPPRDHPRLDRFCFPLDGVANGVGAGVTSRAKKRNDREEQICEARATLDITPSAY